jgi:ankyrin repeat protein
MTEKEKEKAEKKSDEEIMELNLKLLAAAESGKAELIRQLVEEGADVNYASFVPDEDDDEDGDSDYTNSSPATEEQSLEDSQTPDATVSSDGTPESSPEETPEERKKRKRKEKQRKKKLAAANKGPSALHVACEMGHSDAACALVDLGADVNCLMHDLNTPLHLAVAASRKDTVQVLVTLGADLKAKNQLGETPVATGERCGTNSEVWVREAAESWGAEGERVRCARRRKAALRALRR